MLMLLHDDDDDDDDGYLFRYIIQSFQNLCHTYDYMKYFNNPTGLPYIGPI
jgi:hypothetical protein